MSFAKTRNLSHEAEPYAFWNCVQQLGAVKRAASQTPVSNASPGQPLQYPIQNNLGTNVRPCFAVPDAGTKIGLDNALTVDHFPFALVNGIQPDSSRNSCPLYGPEGLVRGIQSGCSDDYLAHGTGNAQRNYSGANAPFRSIQPHEAYAGSGVPLGNINFTAGYGPTHTGGFQHMDNNLEMAMSSGISPQLPDNGFQLTREEHGQDWYAPSGFELQDLENINWSGNSGMRDLRQLAPSTKGLTPQPATPNTNVHRCDVPGCNATFGRPAEFRRHKRTVHKRLGAPEFQCMVQSCSYTYPRLDKVREHMRRVHGIRIQMEKA
ncbi:uncharacterized protein N0V89_005374 [Didymosphaeria variabile]|uniref:C2H2-type domain-containing protein n=1 Tax=Didymosphaeria variabile TaxID=1932322 RepID=A0A9W8XLC3_9PLEO|nr:uncharacterized protein N0V89_005374 [Didymosphaeria variabile]KAJ4353644.1 hypothetical protein N0V89_005374 [Didymosphaeria variabile]